MLVWWAGHPGLTPRLKLPRMTCSLAGTGVRNSVTGDQHIVHPGPAAPQCSTCNPCLNQTELNSAQFNCHVFL